MRGSTLLIVVVAVVVGAIVLIDLGVPSTATSQHEPVSAGPSVGGAWYCAAGAVGETDDLSVITAAPEASFARPGDVEVTALHGARTRIAEYQVFPASAREAPFGEEVAGEAVGAAVRWWDRPVVGSRVWERRTSEGVSGIVSGPCASAPSPTWYVPGLSTADGGTAQLFLANAFPSDASVTITFTTPTGPEEPVRLQNVSVPANSVEVVTLNEFLPRVADLGVTVETRSGRVVVEAVQELAAAVGGVEARTLVRAAPRLAETWTIPWSLTDPTVPEEEVTAAQEETEDADEPSAIVSTSSPGNDTASWLWVSNPGEEAAAVTITLHTADGPVVPDLGDELVIEGGRLLRIDLRGALPPGLAAAGATLRSENGVPVVASTSTLYEQQSGDPGETGYTSQLGSPEPARSWVVPGEAADGRDQVLHLANPGGDDAVVDVTLWNGSVDRRPGELQDVTVPAGSLVELDVTEALAEAPASVAYVTASEGAVVVGRHSVSEDDGPDEWIAHVGVPSDLWAGGDVVPSVDHAPQLLEQLGTSQGLQPRDVNDIAPTPTPTAPAPTEPTPTTPPPTAPGPTTPAETTAGR